MLDCQYPEYLLPKWYKIAVNDNRDMLLKNQISYEQFRNEMQFINSELTDYIQHCRGIN